MTITTIRANLLQTLALVIGGLSLTACTLPKLGYLRAPPNVGRTPIKKPLERANALTANREKHCALSLTATAEVRQ